MRASETGSRSREAFGPLLPGFYTRMRACKRERKKIHYRRDYRNVTDALAPRKCWRGFGHFFYVSGLPLRENYYPSGKVARRSKIAAGAARYTATVTEVSVRVTGR